MRASWTLLLLFAVSIARIEWRRYLPNVHVVLISRTQDGSALVLSVSETSPDYETIIYDRTGVGRKVAPFLRFARQVDAISNSGHISDSATGLPKLIGPGTIENITRSLRLSPLDKVTIRGETAGLDGTYLIYGSIRNRAGSHGLAVSVYPDGTFRWVEQFASVEEVTAVSALGKKEYMVAGPSQAPLRGTVILRFSARHRLLSSSTITDCVFPNDTTAVQHSACTCPNGTVDNSTHCVKMATEGCPPRCKICTLSFPQSCSECAPGFVPGPAGCLPVAGALSGNILALASGAAVVLALGIVWAIHARRRQREFEHNVLEVQSSMRTQDQQTDSAEERPGSSPNRAR